MSSKTLFGPFRVVYKALRINLSLFSKASPTSSFHLEITFHKSRIKRDIFRVLFIRRQIELILNSYAPDLALIKRPRVTC